MTLPGLGEPLDAKPAPAQLDPNKVPLFELTPEIIEATSNAEREAIILDLAQFDLLKLPFENIAIRFPQDEISKVLRWAPMPSEYQGMTVTMFYGGALCVDQVAPKISDHMTAEEGMAHDPTGPVSFEEALKRTDIHFLTVAYPELSYSQMIVRDKDGSRVVNIKRVDAEQKAKGNPGFAATFEGMGIEALTILICALSARNVVKDVRYSGGTGKGASFRPHYEDSGVIFVSRTVVRPPPLHELEGDSSGIIRKAHLRRGHPHTVVHGKGRELRRLQWFAPTFVGYDPAFVPTAKTYKVKP